MRRKKNNRDQGPGTAPQNDAVQATLKLSRQLSYQLAKGVYDEDDESAISAAEKLFGFKGFSRNPQYFARCYGFGLEDNQLEPAKDTPQHCKFKVLWTCKQRTDLQSDEYCMNA